MNNDSQETDRISDRHIEEIEQRAVNNTPRNAEHVLALARANEDDHFLQYQTNRQFGLNDNDKDTLLIVVDSHIKSCSSSVFNKTKTEKPPDGSLDVSATSLTSVRSNISFLSHWSDGQNPHLIRAVEFLHEDKEFLVAAEIGNEKMLQILIRKGVDVQQRDHLGRNALHLVVCTDSEQALHMLLNAGVFTNVKDNVGMTPLSICLMRRPSLKRINLLFDHGAKILPRTSPMDTGLFLQFVMMSTPTEEEVKILQLLTTKGGLINDPKSPGGRQGLHFAAMSDNCELIHVLVDLGADLFLVNHRNETPKEVALAFKCRKAYSVLNQLEALYRESSSTNTTLKLTL